MKIKANWREILFLIGVFASFTVFYTRIVPIVIFNMDDWAFLSRFRAAIPLWKAWNPSRVLPEVMTPLTAQFAAAVIYPVTHDFVRAVESGMAIVISAHVTAYAGTFLWMLRRKYQVSENKAILYTSLFLLLHFLVFRTKSSGNDYLLAGYYDTCTFFFYLIPALWNAVLVMYFIGSDYFITGKEKSLTTRATVAAAIYLAIFSNLHQSIILAAYTAVEFGRMLIRNRKSGTRSVFQGCGMHFYILAMWLISQVFELFGGRAGQVGAKGLRALYHQFRQTADILLSRLGNVNGWFAALLIMVFVSSVIGLLIAKTRGKRKEGPESGCFLIEGILCLLYLLLLCSSSLQGYIQRGDVLIAFFFYLFLFMMHWIRYWGEKQKVAIVYPLILVLLFSQVFTSNQAWKLRINNGLSVRTARSITGEIVSAVMEADREGKKQVEIEVPLFNRGDNWPIAKYGAANISDALYKYGMISDRIKTEFVPTESKNKIYGIPVPTQNPSE